MADRMMLLSGGASVCLISTGPRLSVCPMQSRVDPPAIQDRGVLNKYFDYEIFKVLHAASPCNADDGGLFMSCIKILTLDLFKTGVSCIPEEDAVGRASSIRDISFCMPDAISGGPPPPRYSRQGCLE